MTDDPPTHDASPPDRASIELQGMPWAWDLAGGELELFGLPSVAFWTRPSLQRLLGPLREEVGHDLYRLLVAHYSSMGTEEDYQTMITELGSTFEQGFLAWGDAVSTAGWGRFALLEFDKARCVARVRIDNPWELQMQGPGEDWGCPFLQGKLIGIFTQAFGVTCWAYEHDIRHGHDCAGGCSIEFEIKRSERTIAVELDRLRVERKRVRDGVLADEVERKTSALRELEARLRQSQKLESIGQLAGGVAHDFNNLLTAIMSAADLLAMQVPEQLQPLVETVIEASETAGGVIQKLLDFSRQGVVVESEVDVHAVIQTAVNLIARSVDRQVHVQTQLDAAVSRLRGDPTQLQSALLNLGVNARDAMPQGGQLRVTTRNLTLDAAYCASAAAELAPGVYVEIAVSDTGEGMSAGTQARVFEPFFTTKARGKGTGLGLPSVAGTIREHRGEVLVESELGVGTTFRLRLPVEVGALE